MYSLKAVPFNYEGGCVVLGATDGDSVHVVIFCDVRMYAHNFGWRSSEISFTRFFVPNTRWTWLLTYELGNCVVPAGLDRRFRGPDHVRLGICWLIQQKAFEGLRPIFFGPRIRISCTGHHQHPRVRLSLRKAA